MPPPSPVTVATQAGCTRDTALQVQASSCRRLTPVWFLHLRRLQGTSTRVIASAPCRRQAEQGINKDIPGGGAPWTWPMAPCSIETRQGAEPKGRPKHEAHSLDQAQGRARSRRQASRDMSRHVGCNHGGGSKCLRKRTVACLLYLRGCSCKAFSANATALF